MSEATTGSFPQNARYSTTTNVANPYDIHNPIFFQPADPPTTPAQPVQPADSSGSRKRKRSIRKPDDSPNKAQRTAPITPTQPGKDTPATMGNPLTIDDKKRNKLGYHRTSVACGHCRRRKIRCLIPEDEPSGRCTNCIRLKKDCHFFPVEQAMPASERRGDGNRKSLLPPRKSTAYSPPLKSHPGQPKDIFQVPAPLQFGSRSSFSLPPENTASLGIYTSPRDTSNAATFGQNYETSSEWGMQSSPEFGLTPNNYHAPQAITHTHWNPPYQSVFRSNSDFFPQQHPQDTEILQQGPHRASFQSNPEIGWPGNPLGRTVSYGGQGGQPQIVGGAPHEMTPSQRRASTLPANYSGIIDPPVEEPLSPTSKAYPASSVTDPSTMPAPQDPVSGSLSEFPRGLAQPTVGWALYGDSAQGRAYSNVPSAHHSGSIEQSPFQPSVTMPDGTAAFRPGEMGFQPNFPLTSADSGSAPALSFGDAWSGTY